MATDNVIIVARSSSSGVQPLPMNETLAPSRLSVLLVTDIVGSTSLKGRIGLSGYARLLAAHDALFKRLVASYQGAEILQDTGDGYFASFATTSDAVRFALRFQHELRDVARDPEPVHVRVGIHAGEVAQMPSDGLGQPKLVGMAADLVARVAGMAVGGQILMTRFAFNEARQFVSTFPRSGTGEDSNGHGKANGNGDGLDDRTAAGAPSLKWVAHGPYRLRGSDELTEIFEVGVENEAPMQPPAGGDAARRAVAEDDEDTLGWRPAVGLEVPGRAPWLLERRLGAGGFGEVWLARHKKLGTRRVFKFCFDPDRLRSFKREIALFRLLREALGERKDIARLHEVKIDQSPYFIESDYTEGGDLHEWAEAQGGLSKVPIDTRIEMVAAVADAVAAAHSIGVLHKDIKPSNILISNEDGQARPRLADFGIGMVTDRSRLRERAITEAGFTEVTVGGHSTQTGTRLYSPPEAIIGRPFTVQGDVYALGIVLYQMVVGDLNRPIAGGWERDVSDELIRQDVAACVEGDPQRRLSSANELARRLRSLDERRAENDRRLAMARAAARRQRTTRITGTAVAVLVLLVALAAAVALRERGLRREAEKQRQIAVGVNDFLDRTLTSIDPDTFGKDVTVVRAIDAAYEQLKVGDARRAPEAQASILGTLGRSYRKLGKPDRAQQLLREAYELLKSIKGENDADTAAAKADLGIAILESGQADGAERVMHDAIDTLRRARGPKDRSVLTYSNNYAQVLLALNRIDEAERLIRDVYDTLLRVAGPDDDDTIGALETLAGAVYHRGDYEGAADMFKRVWEDRRRTRGEDHPLTLMAGSNAAVLIYRLDRAAEADAMLGPLIDRQRRVLGETHVRTINAIQNRAAVLNDLGRHDECLALAREAVELRTRAQGPEHRETLAAKRYLGGNLRDAKRFDESIQVLRETLDVQRRTLGQDHGETLDTMRYLAVSLNARGGDAERDEAISLMRHVVDTTVAKLGPSHPTTLMFRMEFAGGLFNKKMYSEAEQQLLPAWEAAQSPTIPGGTRNMIAKRLVKVYEAWGKPELAESFRRLAIAATQPRSASRPTSDTATPPQTGRRGTSTGDSTDKTGCARVTGPILRVLPQLTPSRAADS
jgi:serine/threonine-protein kinase